jgi:hypothetical protein
MPYQPIRKDKVCNWTFVKESDLPDGKKLLECSRCHECWYKDRESQLKHWPYHKKACRSIADEIGPEFLHTEWPDFRICIYKIVMYLKKIKEEGFPDKCGRFLLHMFRELKRHLLLPTGGVEINDKDIILEIVRMYQRCIIEHGREIIDYIWAIPGWAAFFLSEELFMCPEMIRRQKNGIPAILPDDESLSLSSTAYTDTMVKFYAASMAEVGTHVMFINPLAAAVCRSANRAWQSDYVRASFPKHSDWEYIFFPSTMLLNLRSNVFKKFCWPDELVPGMTAKQLLRTMMKDDRFLPPLDENRRSQFLDNIYSFAAYFEDYKNLPWSHLTAKDRIELLDISHDWDAPKGKCGERPAEFFTSVRTCVLHMITGCQTKTLLKVYELCQTMSPPPDERTTKMIKRIRNAMMIQHRPQVAIYNEMIEPKAREQGIDQPLPEVLNSIISEFSFERKYVWASTEPSRKGLRFLADSEEEARFRDLRKHTSVLRMENKENIFDTTPGLKRFEEQDKILSWAQVEAARGEQIEGILYVEAVRDESSMIRQVFQCKDCEGVVRRIAAYTNSRKIPRMKVGATLSWIWPRYHYFADGSSGARIEEEDLDRIDVQ